MSLLNTHQGSSESSKIPTVLIISLHISIVLIISHISVDMINTIDIPTGLIISTEISTVLIKDHQSPPRYLCFDHTLTDIHSIDNTDIYCFDHTLKYIYCIDHTLTDIHCIDHTLTDIHCIDQPNILINI